MEQIVECVANISEGRDQKIISQIAAAIRSSGSTMLLHIDSGKDANRTVYTFAGSPKLLRQSVIDMYATALELIDMRTQTGTHPRIGVVDVCPFIPINGITIEELIPWVESLAQEINQKFDIPIYLYEKSAKYDYRQNLANIRKGQYEGLQEKLADTNWTPDFGTTTNWEKSGASIIGVRPFLLAYNINLNTIDVHIAKNIAKRLRGSGYINSSGQRTPGLFPSVKAIGWFVNEYDCAQVSMNLTNINQCSMHHAYAACSKIALEYETIVTGSELIGLTPLKALLAAGTFYGSQNMTEKQLIQIANDALGLSSVKEFIPQHRVIEYLLKSR